MLKSIVRAVTAVRGRLRGVGGGERNPIIDNRRLWLAAQYREPGQPQKGEYTPQPYTQLAHALRTAGYFKEADDITHDKLELEHVTLAANRLSRWLWRSLVQIPFGYGLRWKRAALTFGIWLALGAGLTQFLAPLVVDTSAVSTVLSTGPGDELLTVIPVEPGATPPPGEASAKTAPGPVSEVPCDQRESFVYALDVMLPLLDLRQESRCKMSAEERDYGFAWRAGKALYAVAGWVVLSGLILTVSGVVRRQVEK
jgi:hypothetical protein